MAHEQEERFTAIRDMLERASNTVASMKALAAQGLTRVDHDSSEQAEVLQRLQQSAGMAVQTLTDVSETAKHARSYQAQAHSAHSGDKPR
ncbi:MAG: hypothetical protein K6T83_05055 [Alicyclobacillus sp.]|nr:hypothetical protein [Alicyclobacillus sp.]